MRERWLSRRAVSLHVSLLLFVPGCGLAAWWQITRAFDGNGLSYLYSVEWPIFAVLAAYFWWMLIHTDYEAAGLEGMRRQAALTLVSSDPAPSPPPPIPAAGEDDPDLAAYNARLAALAARGPKTWRTPERTVVRREGVRRLTGRGLPGNLFRYQLMANIVGTLIIPLFVFTGIKIFAGRAGLEVEVFGVTHGYLYIVYLVMAGILGLRARLNVLWILLMFGAGLVPGLTFVVEWLIVTRKIHPLLAAAESADERAVSPAAR